MNHSRRVARNEPSKEWWVARILSLTCKFVRAVFWGVLVCSACFLIFLLLSRLTFSSAPSLYRDWRNEDAVVSSVAFSGTEITLSGIRDITWVASWEYNLNATKRTFALADISQLSLLRSRDKHVFFLKISFWEGDPLFLQIWPRLEVGERLNFFGAFLSEYEIQYWFRTIEDFRWQSELDGILFDEIPLSESLHRDLPRILRSLLVRTLKLSQEPEYYHPLWNSFSTNLIRHCMTDSLWKDISSLTLDAGLLDAGCIDDDAFYRFSR